VAKIKLNKSPIHYHYLMRDLILDM